MFELKNEKKNIKIILAVVCMVFLCLSIFSNLKYGDANLLGSYEKMDNDDLKYIRSAWTLLETKVFSYHDPVEKTAFIMPGLPFTLSFFIGIFGRFEGVMAFRIFQSFLQTLSLLLVFFIGRKLFGSKVGIIAFILDALYIPEIWATNVILTEVIFKFSLLLLLYISIYAVETKEVRYYIAGGIVWGITALFRPTIAAFPAVILVMWIYKKYKFKEIVKYTLITTAVFATVMSPWWIRNYVVFDKFIPLTLSSGTPLVQASYINYDTSIDYYPWKDVDDRIEQEKYFKENVAYRFKHYMLKRPIPYLKWYLIDKSVELWESPFYWNEVFGISSTSAVTYHALILILGVAGMIAAFVDKKHKLLDHKFLFAFVTLMYFEVLHIPYVTFSRYSYPVISVLMLFAAYVIYKIYIKFKRESKASIK